MTVELTWARREPPLPVVAVAASGSSAAALRASTEDRLRHGADLRACLGEGWALVLGAADDLPWVPGAVYLGADDGLLVPSALRPGVPAGLLRAAAGADALAILPDAILSGPAPVRTADPDLVRAAP